MANGYWHWYPTALANILNKEIDLDSDPLYILLLESAYNPIPAHEFESDLTNEVVGEGYIAGGQLLTGVSVSALPDSALSPWAAGTQYRLGQVRRPTIANGYIYRCVVAGVSGGGEPAWPEIIGREVADGNAVWACVGKTLIKLDANDPNWPASTITAGRAVVVDKAPGNPAQNPLIGYCLFDGNVSSDSGDFDITFDPDGFLHLIL
jgi:hypothetical protein